MIQKKWMLGLLLFTGVSFTACEQAKQQAQEQANQVMNRTNDEVQKVINDLGLVYVEEGAQTVITYDEVNAAQQAWCNALVKIGDLKESGGDY